MKRHAITIIASILLLVNIGFAQSRTNAKTLNEGLNDLSQQISNELSENRKQRVAVIEFVNLQGEVTDLGRYLSEKLITKLFQTKKLRVVERQLLNKVITEQKLSLTGIIDPSSAQKLGRLLGVDAIAAGSISDLTKTIEINARLISTETGEVFSAASTEIIKDEIVCNLMGDCNNSASSNSKTSKQTSNPTSTKPKSWKVESNFFTFDLHICRRSGTSVICEFTITNNDKDRDLRIYGGSNSKLYDENNYESKGGGSEIANSGKHDYYSKAFLVNGIPTKARVYFEKFSTTSNKITRMDIRLCPQGSDCFDIQYRNIPIGEYAQAQNSNNSQQKSSRAKITHNAGETASVAISRDVYMQFAWIPPGEFMIGAKEGEKGVEKDETPQKLIKITKGFWMGKYEVTRKQWKAIMGYEPRCVPEDPCGDDLPVEMALWDRVKEFIDKLNKKNTEFIYRLPSEAEWEYAARAGTNTRFYWGDDPDYRLICFYANVFDRSRNDALYSGASLIIKPVNCSDRYINLAPVGSFKPNNWGLYDMVGNVGEWCEDNYIKSYEDIASDGTAYRTTKKSDTHVFRGGDYSILDRSKNRITNRSKSVVPPNVGFRIIAEAKDS